MGNATCVDTDGHVLERPEDIRKYLEAPWNERGTPLWPGDQPWDPNLFKGFKMAVNWEGLAPEEQVRRWHTLMDNQDMETAICFPTGSGNIAKNQEVPFQVAATKAANTHFAKEYNALSNRLSCVGVLPNAGAGGGRQGAPARGQRARSQGFRDPPHGVAHRSR